MSSVFISSPAEVVVIDSRTRAGTITLPVTNAIPYRTINFKDQYGSFSNSTLTVSTQLGESFDDGTTSKIFSNAFTYLSLYATSSKWMVMNATQTIQQTISSLTVNQLTFGTGAGWVQFGPIQATVVSSIQENTQTAYIGNVLVGNLSTVNAIQYYGLFGNYNNTVMAEISTGAGTQELLVFKGSSTSDRVRFQTTGDVRFETGVSARLWSNTTIPTFSNVTPAMIINTSSNVGIQTASPGATLDVAGTGRFVTLSSQQLFVSSISGVSFIQQTDLTSTVRGLGSAGYASTTFVTGQISSFSTALGSAGSGNLTTANLTSTVAGLGTVGYVSTVSLVSTTLGIQRSGFISTPNLLNLVSTQNLIGLVSTPNLLNLISSPNLVNLISTQNLSGLVSTPNLLNLVSSQNLNGLVSTTFLDTSLISTTQGLGSVGYISTSQLTSTIRGLGTLGYLSSTNFGYVSTGATQGSSFNIIDPYNNNMNYLTVSSGILLLNGSAISGGGGGGAGVSQIVAGSGISVSPPAGTGIVTVSAIGPTQADLVSTVQGLGSSGYASTSYVTDQISSFSTALGSVGSGNLTTENLTSTVVGLGTVGYVSSASLLGLVSTTFLNITLASTTQGLGTAGYVSSANLLNLVSTGFLNTSLTSTTQGLGTAGYVSSASLLNLVSTAFLNTSLASTLTGLGTFGYISSLSLRSTVGGLGQTYVSTATMGINFSTFSTSISRSFNSSNVTISTLFASNATMSNLTVSTITFNTGDGFIDFPDIRALSLSTFLINTSTINVGSVLSTQVLEVSSIIGPTFLNLANLTSTTAGITTAYQTSGFISSANLLDLVSTPNLIGLVSTPNLLNLVSTTYLTNSLTSTVEGLGASGYISSSSLFSTVAGLGSTGYISSLSNIPYLSAQQILASSIYANVAGPVTLVLYDI